MKRKRHWLLPILCIMTFLGSGFGLFISILSIIDIQLIRFIIQIPSYTSVATNIADAHFSYSIVKILLYSLSIAGAWYMFLLKKRGFFMYMAAQLLLPLISFLFLPYPMFQIVSIVIPEFIFAFAFIALYALHLGSMIGKTKGEKIEEAEA